MKLATGNIRVERGGGVENSEGEFSIEMNAKAFRVLSSTLYQNKIGSIVREISCNAMDSHIAARKADVPFVIHIPSRFEPEFRVRDFGVGLSDEDVHNIYTRYFKSTKDDANDQVGAFGLGSKTPFAYTDSFTVTSVYGGKKSIYAIFLKENGIPGVSTLSVTDTDECNGVEVNIPVMDGRDIQAFEHEVRSQLRYLTVKPKIENSNIEIADGYSGATFVSGGISLGMGGGFVVVQGGVGYRIDTAGIQTSPAFDSKMRDILYHIAGVGGVINVPIGSIEVTASREGIEYTKTTVGTIMSILQKFSDEVVKDIKTKLDGFKTQWERVHFINNNRDILKLASLTNFKIDNVPNVIKWGQQYAFSINPALLREVEVEETDKTTGKTVKSKIKARAFHVTKMVFNGNNVIVSRKFEAHNEYVIPHDDSEAIVIFRDQCKAPVARIKSYIHNRGMDGVSFYVVNPNGEYTDTDIDNIRAMLHGGKVLVASTFPDPPKATRSSGNYSRPRAYTLSPNGSYEYDSWERAGSVRNWEKHCEDVAEIEECYYVLKGERQNIDMASSGIDSATFVQLLEVSKLWDKDVVCLSEKEFKKVSDNTDWEPLSKLVDRVKAAVLKDPAFIDYIGKTVTMQAFSSEFAETLKSSSRGPRNFLVNIATEIGDTEALRVFKEVQTVATAVQTSPYYRGYALIRNDAAFLAKATKTLGASAANKITSVAAVQDAYKAARLIGEQFCGWSSNGTVDPAISIMVAAHVKAARGL